MGELVLGIDIGGSGMKGAPVDIVSGELEAKRFRIKTPQESTPEALAHVAVRIKDHFDWTGPVGFTFPGVVRSGVIGTAANLDPSWVGTDAVAVFSKALGCEVKVCNDADAAGVAEMGHGAGKGQTGVAIMITLGTGIGSALFTDGKLVPNTEFGHLIIDGVEAESRAASRILEEDELSWEEWGGRVGRFLQEMENLFWPELIIVGGGVSKDWSKFGHYVDLRTKVVPAKMRNRAGIIGAAIGA